ncbi:MAG: hypothetical protein DRJ65_00035 [Acidobacteria bacterium]|nr:MAG: hypothetical protein DRJ65_00035 [Acidobacteriota bacterium]
MNTNHLLERYFTLRRDIPVSTPLGRDPTSSRVPSSDFSASVGLLADVGMCLARLSVQHQDTISERWAVWLAREDADEMVSQWSHKALSAMRANRKWARKRARRKARDWKFEARRMSSYVSRHDRDPIYIEAMRLFCVEVKARDLIALTCCGESGRFSGMKKSRSATMP